MLRIQYPDYRSDQDLLGKPPGSEMELAWRYQLWSIAYLVSKPPDPKAAADWHDCWVPGVIRRLSAVTEHRERACRGAARDLTISTKSSTHH